MKIQAAVRMHAEKKINFPDSVDDLMQEFSDILQNKRVDWKGDRRHNAGYYLYSLRNSNPEKAKKLADLMERQATTHKDLPERTIRQAISVLNGTRSEL